MNIELCRAEEVADALGIKLDTLYRYARKGRIRGMKVGKSWRFLQADIHAFLQQHEYRVKPAENTMRSEIKPNLLPDMLRRAALECGIQRTLACGGAEASYADLDRASNLLADSLLSRGVVPGDRVLLLLSTSLEFVAACFAVWKAGAVVVAEDPAIQDDCLCPVLRNCAPQAMIVDRAVAERLDARRHGLENLSVVYVKGQTFRLAGLDGVRVDSLDTALENKTSPALLRFNSASPDDVATLTYTRGAAGRDNGVKNTHQNWLAGAAFTVEYLGLTKQDILVLPLPLHQSLALRQMLAYVRAGARILLAPTLDQAVKFMKDQRPTALALQPGQVQPLLEKFSPAFQKLAASLRYVKIGSGPLEARKLDSLRRLLPRTLILLSRNPTEAQSGFLKARPGGSPNGSCPPAPALALRIADEHRVQAPPGQSDRIFLTGPGMRNAFWGQSDHEMAMLIMDGYCSGGRAIAGKPGGVTLLGHGQEMLRIRGRIVNPAEIEAVLRRHVGVAECAVTGLLDAAGGFETAIHAFVAPTSQGRPADRAGPQALLPRSSATLQSAGPHPFSGIASQFAQGRRLRQTPKAPARGAVNGRGKWRIGRSKARQALLLRPRRRHRFGRQRYDL